VIAGVRRGKRAADRYDPDRTKRGSPATFVAVRLSCLIGGVALLGACGEGSTDSSAAASACMDPPRGPAMTRFADVTHDSGVHFQYATPDFKGGGLAVADLDGDGLPEIVAGRRIGGLALFHNLGSLRFQKVADSGLDAGAATTAIAAIDLDNDGDRDLVLASAGVAYVMANQGDGTFREAARLDGSGVTEHVLPVDLDGDGLLDLYFSNYDLSLGTSTLNRVYLNRGGLQFAFAGTAGAGLSWTASAFDFDGDGDQDLYVANDTLLADFGRPVPTSPATSSLHADLLLRNDGPGPDGMPRFTDVAADMGMTTPRSSMGGLVGDFGDDGRLDLYIPNFGAKKLLLRNPAGDFVESAAMLGVEGIVRRNAACGPETENEDCLLLSWSAALSDFDLDGYDELLVVNGETELGKPPPVLMFVRGPELPYHEVSSDIGCLDARGLVVTDLDGDGDQDVVISQKEGPLMVYKNLGRPASRSWLRVELHGAASNREGVGAVVTAHMASGRSQMRVVGAGGIIHSSSPAEAFFGLGRDAVETLEVRWPSGRRTEVTRPPPGALRLEEQSP
jgi:enediyne biosynthesis protein E4